VSVEWLEANVIPGQRRSSYGRVSKGIGFPSAGYNVQFRNTLARRNWRLNRLLKEEEEEGYTVMAFIDL